MRQQWRLSAGALLVAVALSGCRSSSGSSDVPVAPSMTSVAGVALPPVGGRFSYQVGGAYVPAPGVAIVDRDRTAAADVSRYSICYVNAFQAQKDARADWTAHHPDLLLRHPDGSVIIDTDWDEPLFDISTAAKRTELIGIVDDWLDGCARSGFRAVEADNLDSYTRSDGELTPADALAFATLLARRAHDDHLAIGQKNVAELSGSVRAIGFDFAVAEECQVYVECDAYTAVYGREVIEIEYTDQSLAFFRAACSERGSSVSVVRRDRQVLPAGEPGHVEQWC